MPRYRPRIIAHRGEAAHAPENTLAAFRMALASGADALETDLWLTTDDRVVLHHDATADRMAGDPRRIDRMTLADVRRLAIASPDGPQRVPILDELLELAPHDALLVLELKDPAFADPGRCCLVLDAIDDRIRSRTVVLVSFALRVLEAVKSVRPDTPIGHITLRNPLPTQPTELLGPYWPLLAVNPLYVAMAHQRGRMVAPLDPSLHRRLPRYLRMGVDAVLTDDPAATRALIDRLLGATLPLRPL